MTVCCSPFNSFLFDCQLTVVPQLLEMPKKGKLSFHSFGQLTRRRLRRRLLLLYVMTLHGFSTPFIDQSSSTVNSEARTRVRPSSEVHNATIDSLLEVRFEPQNLC